MTTTDNTDTVVRIDIPLDHHPDTIRGTSAGAVTGRAALTLLYEANGKISDAANQVRDKGGLASAVLPFAERAINRAGRQLTTLRAQLTHLDNDIGAAITPKQNDPHAGEIRAYWLAKSAKGKLAGAQALKELHDVFSQGDLKTISALLSAPAYLSGIHDEQQVLLRGVAAKAVAPEKVAAHEETQAAIASVERVLTEFSKTVAEKINQWRDDNHKRLEKLLGATTV